MITAIVIGIILLFVYLCTLNGDAKFRKDEGLPADAELPAPDWARVLFVLVMGGLVFICLGLPIAAGIAQGLETLR